MNSVLIIPTGIGAEIGGHSGDGNTVAKLIASVSDTMIIHPNVVNAADVNEMTTNMLYVEGSILDRFLEGKIELQRVHSNKILVVVNSPLHNETVNAVSTARVTIGINVEILVLNTPLQMIAKFENGIATGTVLGWKELIEQVKKYDFDALAIATPIKIDKTVELNYFENGGVNPLGGVEAKASKLIANALNKPVAHSPVLIEEDNWLLLYNEIVDPRMSAEMTSVCFLHCILKGLHKAPRIGKGLSVNDVDVMISPHGCWGRPHIACRSIGIPIIIVKENTTVCNATYPSGNDLIFVENYLEAVGVIQAIKEGISLESIRRPISQTIII